MSTSPRIGSAFLVILISLAGCAGALDNKVEVRPEAEAVRLVSEIDPGCKQLGDVFGTADAEGDQEAATRGARNDLRNKAYEMQATHVVLQTSGAARKMGVWGARHEVTMSGVAYRCPASAE
jgi:hypothetical protein